MKRRGKYPAVFQIDDCTHHTRRAAAPRHNDVMARKVGSCDGECLSRFAVLNTPTLVDSVSDYRPIPEFLRRSQNGLGIGTQEFTGSGEVLETQNAVTLRRCPKHQRVSEYETESSLHPFSIGQTLSTADSCGRIFPLALTRSYVPDNAPPWFRAPDRLGEPECTGTGVYVQVSSPNDSSGLILSGDCHFDFVSGIRRIGWQYQTNAAVTCHKKMLM